MYAHKIGPDDLHIDWSAPAAQIHRQVRVGGAWTTRDGERFKVWRTAPRPDAATGSCTPRATVSSSCIEVQPAGQASDGRVRMGQRRPLVGGRSTGHVTARTAPSSGDPGVAARRLALDALGRIEEDGAYANLVTNAMLDRSGLERPRSPLRDRPGLRHDAGCAGPAITSSIVTAGATSHLASAPPFASGPTSSPSATWPPTPRSTPRSSATPKPARGLVNAVLRRVAADVEAGIDWPDLGTELSYPDWVVSALEHRLGAPGAASALAAMNRPAVTHVRSDGYVQDPASQAVVDVVAAGPGDRVLDVCAAPGGKATGLAAAGAAVIAADQRPHRARLVVANAARTGVAVPVVVADGCVPPFRTASFDRVLVDAPCSGLGVLRRRPDARWRIDPEAPDRLQQLQLALLRQAAPLVAPGGRLVYSVCTLTDAENHDVVDQVGLPSGFAPISEQTLAPDADRDGMFIAVWERDL